jgi:hypothetical protein
VRTAAFPHEAQHVEHPRIRSLSRDFPATCQGTPTGQIQGQSNAQAGPSRSAQGSFLRLVRSLQKEQEEGVTYYKRKDFQDGGVGPSNDAYSIAQEAKANKRRYGS